VKINRDGYRDRPWTAPPGGEAAPVRLLALGDSFTFGMGVEAEQTFVQNLETEIPGGRLITFNAGVPGYGPAHERVILEELADRVRPDLVVMVLYTGNDLEDTQRLEHPESVAAPVRRRSDQNRRRHVPEILARLGSYRYWTNSSRVCAYTLPFFARLAVRLGLADPRLVYNSFMIRSCATDLDATAKQALEGTVRAVEDTALRCGQLEARFLVLLAPAALFADPALFDRFFERQQAYERQDHSPDILHARLVSECERRGIAVLDLLPMLRRLQVDQKACYHPEGHWNAFGHHAVGRALAEVLGQKGWI
jgi:hypothetical protein